MKRSVAGLVIVFVGAAVLQLAISGTYLRYVKPGMRWMLLAAGVVLIGLAVSDVFARNRQTHDHGLPRAAWLLLIPVFALLVVDPPALGADAARRQSPVAAKPAAPEGNSYWRGQHSYDAQQIAVRDYATWAVWNQDSMKGRTFRLTGFVTPDKKGVWYVTRIGVTCCVADASAFMVEARGHAAPAKNQWVIVTGTWATPTRRVDGDVAALVVQSVEPTTAPANPYE
ncbi:TIGR03943 family putative permease subunit [Kribbella sp. WER1]